MLVASGLGSKYSVLIDTKTQRLKVLAIFIIIGVYAILLGLLNPIIFSALSNAGVIIRILISVVLIFPLGFFMGMPFPIGISLIRDSENRYIPLAWAVNGFFSVIGTVLTMIFAMIFGFKIVFIFTGVLYLIALVFMSLRLKRIFVYL
jgi:MFS family permease